LKFEIFNGAVSHGLAPATLTFKFDIFARAGQELELKINSLETTSTFKIFDGAASHGLAPATSAFKISNGVGHELDGKNMLGVAASTFKSM
jgi:hypothetical protein